MRAVRQEQRGQQQTFDAGMHLRSWKSSSDGAGADVSCACLVGAAWFWVLVVVAASVLL